MSVTEPAVASKAPLPRPRRTRIRWKSRSPYLRALTYLILLTLAVIYIYPFLIELGTAFKTTPDATAHAANPVPSTWVTTAFKSLESQDFPRWFANSVFVAVTVTVGRLLFDSMAGYALARIRFVGRQAIFAAFIATLAVPSVVLLIPKFLVDCRF